MKIQNSINKIETKLEDILESFMHGTPATMAKLDLEDLHKQAVNLKLDNADCDKKTLAKLNALIKKIEGNIEDVKGYIKTPSAD